VLALSYSGRWDLKTAMQTLARRVQDGTLDPDAIDEQAISEALTTRDLPDPDLLIRTGGDYRVSNFLLWEIAYTELYISDEFWPAFRRPHLYEAIRNFQDRERRFGRVKH
jgi:undecaprenyl diphosphate synthase